MWFSAAVFSSFLKLGHDPISGDAAEPPMKVWGLKDQIPNWPQPWG